ncbi:MAG: efflux RND transporter periplasmic adaptor subunit [Pseudomonadota bacterium]
MNMIPAHFSLSHRASALATAILLALAPPQIVHAANGTTRFTVAASQLQVMGIETVPLQVQGEPVRVNYPAQTVLPPSAEQVISSPVAGLVMQLLVQPNQLVRPGAPLLRIASPELGQMQLQLLQATSRATLARQTAQREQSLFSEGLIAQRRVQEAQAGLQEAEAALRQAKSALRLGGMSAGAIDKVAASGNPQDSLVLAASQAGVVTEISARAGQRVDSAAPLLRLAQTNTLWLEIQVPAAEASAWPSGTKLKVKGRDVTASVVGSSALVASGSQMLAVRALVDGKSGQLRPGELVSVELSMSSTAVGWDLPLAALARDGSDAYIFVRTADGFEARAAKVLASGGQRARVQVDAKAGEQVAVTGVVALKGAWLDAKDAKDTKGSK